MAYSAAERTELRARWSPARAGAVNGSLAKDIGKCEGLSRYEGRLDLRGLSIAGNVIYKSLASIDLSCCSFEQFGQFNSCRFIDCLFSSAEIRNNLKNTFDRCCFQGARLRELTMGEVFGSCDFMGSRWSRVLAVRATFTACSFRNVQFDQVKLLECRFVGCEFDGVEFRRSELGGTVFMESGVDRKQFVDCYMEGVRLEE